MKFAIHQAADIICDLFFNEVTFCLLVCGIIVVGGWKLTTSEPEPDYAKVNFKAACDVVKGTTIWNGREYACLK